MKVLISIIVAAIVAISPVSFAKNSGGTGAKASSTPTKAYTKKDGTYVQSYRRTTPDRTQRNNYSAAGNYNPNTGKVGTKEPKK